MYSSSKNNYMVKIMCNIPLSSVFFGGAKLRVEHGSIPPNEKCFTQAYNISYNGSNHNKLYENQSSLFMNKQMACTAMFVFVCVCVCSSSVAVPLHMGGGLRT